MDRAIGRLLDRLDALGLADETLVCFTSDNGFNMGHHGVLGKGNGTFPLNMLEESVRVPFLVRWPGRVRAGRVHDGLISHLDFMPTILEALGVDNPVAAALPGRSFARALRGEPGGREAVVVCEEYGPVRMVRERDWKYVHRYPYGPHELYHLAEDPAETRNLVEDAGSRAALIRLRQRLEEWFLDYGDPRLDGVRQPVTGKGQIDLIGPAGGGWSAFA
jgi:arylsulfatase A-like enzyme